MLEKSSGSVLDFLSSGVSNVKAVQTEVGQGTVRQDLTRGVGMGSRKHRVVLDLLTSAEQQLARTGGGVGGTIKGIVRVFCSGVILSTYL